MWCNGWSGCTAMQVTLPSRPCHVGYVVPANPRAVPFRSRARGLDPLFRALFPSTGALPNFGA